MANRSRANGMGKVVMKIADIKRERKRGGESRYWIDVCFCCIYTIDGVVRCLAGCLTSCWLIVWLVRFKLERCKFVYIAIASKSRLHIPHIPRKLCVNMFFACTCVHVCVCEGMHVRLKCGINATNESNELN